MTNNKLTLQECAMRYGTGMGVFWAFKFALFPLGLRIPFLQLIFMLLTLAVPVLGYVFAKRYRNLHNDGHITFARAFLFTLVMYMFASLFVAFAHYIYFRYLDGGFIVNTYLDLWTQVKDTVGAELMPALEQYDEALNLIAGLTPMEMTMQLISNNVFLGTLTALPTALLVMRKKKEQQEQE